MMELYKILWFFRANIYALLTSIFSFFGTNEMPFLNKYTTNLTQQDVISEFGNAYKNLDDILSLDYLDLVVFSKKMEAYSKTSEEFKMAFNEGIFKSLEFYKSSKIDQSEVNDLIEVNLSGNATFYHSIEKLRANKIDLPAAFSSLDQFSGEWHGNWEEMQVHHLWLPVRELTQSVTNDVTLMGFQSCFISDGFGWNYVVKQSERIIILGYVVHFDQDGTIRSKNPHYGFLNNNNQLTWITGDHIYHEFICNNPGCSNKKHYVISGAVYDDTLSGQLKFSKGFQTIYSSDDQDLSAFRRLNLDRSNF